MTKAKPKKIFISTNLGTRYWAKGTFSLLGIYFEPHETALRCSNIPGACGGKFADFVLESAVKLPPSERPYTIRFGFDAVTTNQPTP